MALELIEDAKGDARNAKFLAAASQFAYYPADRGAEAFKSELGLDAKLISIDNTQAYVASNAEHLVVAFRGSEGPTSIDGLKDWLLTNAMNLLIIPEGPLGADFAAAGVGAKFHQGFVSAITEIWSPLESEVQTQLAASDRPLWVTGHSLGGALAILAAWLFRRRTINVHQVYTFGAPMVGNADTAAAISRDFAGKIFRYVNPPDPVPLLPMMSLIANDFSHVETLVPLPGDGATADALSFAKDMALQAGSAVFSGHLQDEFWTALKGRINAHLLDDYRKLL